MKKLITTIAFIALSTVSAKAIDFETFSLTGGIATNNSVWGATATQDEYNAGGTAIDASNKQSGVFTESFGSQFVELGIGRYISLGFEHVPDSISTPENVNTSGGVSATGDTAKVSVDFNDMNTTYLKVNTPMGIYLKWGNVSTDIDIKETMLSGNTYKNTSVDGTSIGAGYQKTFGERGFGFRIEGNYVELDNVTVNNGVTKTGGTPANHGFAEVKAKNLEGLTGKVALTYTFGRSGNTF
ncbi:hypothetical protein [Candidatus Pelagibacter sp. Uisw_137]|uniref:hypothetical protein n=1 Tax=Candidatus Pelagibacter sp. Uisw_137 TaxID=3230992 RepID=UPI0039ED052B